MGGSRLPRRPSPYLDSSWENSLIDAVKGKASTASAKWAAR